MKVKVYEQGFELDREGKEDPKKPVVREHDMETVDAKEAVEHDPERYSYADPRLKKKDQDPNAGPGQPRYRVEHTGGKKYSVIDTSNEQIVDSGLDKEAAEAKAAQLGSGHWTTSPNT